MNSKAVETVVTAISNLEAKMPNTSVYMDLVTGLHCIPNSQSPETTWIWVGRARDLMFLYDATKMTTNRKEAKVLARQMAQRHINSVLGFQ